MDPHTGEILAMANIPDYDLNDPPRDDIETLQDLSRNRVVVDVYEPGSTFKVVTTSAALDSGAVTTETTCLTARGTGSSTGRRSSAGGITTRTATKRFMEAVQNSCNPCFVDMALLDGQGNSFITIFMRSDSETAQEIDFTADEAGIVTAEKYVKNVDLARIGFGQSIAVTPLQLATCRLRGHKRRTADAAVPGQSGSKTMTAT